jgi:hypothetical protein
LGHSRRLEEAAPAASEATIDRTGFGSWVWVGKAGLVGVLGMRTKEGERENKTIKKKRLKNNI